MFKKLVEKKRLWQIGEITVESYNQAVQSYLGLLKYCGGYKRVKEIIRI